MYQLEINRICHHRDLCEVISFYLVLDARSQSWGLYALNCLSPVRFISGRVLRLSNTMLRVVFEPTTTEVIS